MEPILNRVAEMQDEITGWRRHLHTIPEILYDVHKSLWAHHNTISHDIV